MKATLISFGFKSDRPMPAADEFLDVRGMRNPFSVPALKGGTGLDKNVQDFVQGDSRAKQVLALARMALKPDVKIAFGCHGGKHRSVALAELLAADLRKEGWQVETRHEALVAHGLVHA